MLEDAERVREGETGREGRRERGREVPLMLWQSHCREREKERGRGC